MFNVALDNLIRNVRTGELRISRFLKSRPKMLSRIHGPAWDGDDPMGEDTDLENQGLSWLLMFKARVAFHNPIVDIDTPQPGLAQMDAAALEEVLQRIIEETDYRGALDETSDDAGINWSVVMTTRELRPEHANLGYPSYAPHYAVLSPEDVGWDAWALHRKRLRLIWHKYTRDLADVIEEAKEDRKRPKDEREGWNLDVLEGLGVDDATELSAMYGHERELPGLERGIAVFRDIWVPEYELPWVTERFERQGKTAAEAGFHGTIFTIAMNANVDWQVTSAGPPDIVQQTTKENIDRLISMKRAGFPRNPRPYFGPPCGPYAVIGLLNVPGSPIPLSSLVANEAGISELNAADKLLSRRMRKRKRGVAYDSKDKQTGKIIQDFEDGDIFGIPHLGEDGGKLQDVVVGAYDEVDLNYRNDRREQTQRNMGMGDALQGEAQPDTTATADNIAATASASRFEVFASNFLRGHEQVLRTMAWYAYHDPDYRVLIGKGDEAGVWIGGKPDEDQIRAVLEEFSIELDEQEFEQVVEYLQADRASFADMRLRVRLTSTARESEGVRRQRAADASGVLTGVLPAAPSLEPYFNVKEFLRRIGRDLNIEWLHELYRPDDALKMLGVQMAANTQGSRPDARMAISPAGIASAQSKQLIVPGASQTAGSGGPALNGRQTGSSLGAAARGGTSQLAPAGSPA